MNLVVTAAELQSALDDAVARAMRESIDDARLLSIETASELLAVSPGTFRTIARQAGIKPVVLGSRCVRWRLTDLRTLQVTKTPKTPK